MAGGPVRVWWLDGAPCVGKSVTAWRLYADLLDGAPRAHLDVDQLGICYPAPHDDAERERMKVRAAAVLVGHLVRAGARTVVVSGVLGPGSRARVAQALPGVEVTFCRLRADADVLRPRLDARYGPEDAARALAEAREWDEQDAGPAVVDTQGEVGAVAGRVLRVLRASAPTEAASGSAPAPAPLEDDGTGETRPPRGVLVCGTRGVGKSTVAFGLTMQAWSTGRTCAFLDLGQLSFLAGVTHQRLPASATAAAVADLWRAFAAAGAVDLVLNGGPLSADDVDAYRSALGPAPLLVVALRAEREALRQRIGARARGEGGPELAGDDLRGLDADAVEQAAEDAFAVQEQEAIAHDVVVIPTDGADPQALVDRVAQLRAARGSG